MPLMLTHEESDFLRHREEIPSPLIERLGKA